MIITDVQIKEVETNNRIIALANVTFDNCFIIKDVKILKDKNDNIFIGMPSIKHEDNSYSDLVYPINKESRSYITSEIIKAYNSYKNKA